jgi:hypothetical protein
VIRIANAQKKCHERGYRHAFITFFECISRRQAGRQVGEHCTHLLALGDVTTPTKKITPNIIIIIYI